MMKINFFILVLLLAGFISCSDSESTDYEKGNLMGNYVGNCNVSLGSSGSIYDTVSNFPAEFRQNDTQSLSLNIGNLESYQSVGIFITKKATGFKDHGSYAQFNLENINVDFQIDQIPDFIKNNIKLTWDMKSATLKLSTDSKNSPKYAITSKTLTFTYTGIIEISGKNSGEKYSSPITYVFNLNKK